MRRRMHICSGSRTVITALAKIITESALVWESTQALEKLIGSIKVTLAWVPGHYGIPGNEEPDKLSEKGTNGFPSYQMFDIPFVVGKEVIWSHLRREHLNRWKTCEVCCHSNTVMSETLPSRKKELQAMSRQKLKVAVGMLKGHTTLRANMFKLEIT
jgi:ribonuclease HI